MTGFAAGGAPVLLKKPHTEPEIVSKAVKKRIYVSVIVIHVVLVIGPYIMYLVDCWLHPVKKDKAIIVEVVDLPLNGKPPPKGNSPTGKGGGGGSGDRRKTEIPKTPKVKDTKATQPKVAETPKIKDVKPEVKPTVKPEPAAVKPDPVPPKDPPTKALSPNDIKIDKTKVVVKTPDKPVKPVDKSKPIQPIMPIVPAMPDFSSSNLADKIKKGMEGTNKVNPNINISSGPGIKGWKSGLGVGPVDDGEGIKGASNGTDDGTGGQGSELDKFYAVVRVYIDGIWKEPGKAQLGGAKPVVVVEVSVDSYGKILSAEIIQRSNNIAMDTSVENLLKEIKKFPKAPPNGALKFTLTLDITDKK